MPWIRGARGSRQADDILAEVLGYPSDAAGAAGNVGTSLASLETVLAELAPRIDERDHASSSAQGPQRDATRMPHAKGRPVAPSR